MQTVAQRGRRARAVGKAPGSVVQDARGWQPRVLSCFPNGHGAVRFVKIPGRGYTHLGNHITRGYFPTTGGRRRRMVLSPEYAFLGFLAQRPTHGYELHQRLTADLGHIWHASTSQTYNILKRLERQGFIAGTVQEQANRPDRIQFHLTAAGRRRFNAWLHAVAPAQSRAIRLDFSTRLYFANAIHPELVSAVVEAQAAEIRARLAALKPILAGLPPDQILNRQSLRLRVRQMTLLLDWVQECRKALEETP